MTCSDRVEKGAEVRLPLVMSIVADENPEFDHLLHWVPDVARAVGTYAAAGLPAHANEVLDGFQNGGWRLDERYVEILTITDERRLRASRYAEGIEHLRPAMEAVSGGRGAITFAVNVRDARATAARLREQGFDVAEFEVTLKEHGVSFVEIFVLNAPPWTPFFITYSPPRDELMAGIDPSAFQRGRYDLTGIVVETADPEGSAELLATMLGIAGDGGQVALPGGRIAFERGDREMITAMTVSGGTREAVDVDGLTVRFAA